MIDFFDLKLIIVSEKAADALFVKQNYRIMVFIRLIGTFG